jgi:arsenite transporter
VIAWGLLQLLPADPAMRLGVLLVLLVPCTDWFIAFVHLGGGDTRRAIAVTPVNLLVQLAVLPLYLWLIMGQDLLEPMATERVAAALAALIVLPLLCAFLTRRWAVRRGNRAAVVQHLGMLVVPLLALVVFLVAASQVNIVSGSLRKMGPVLAVFVVYLVLAACLGRAIAGLLGLPPAAARTLIFSFGTRNSIVVLPFALALPASWGLVPVVIVFQSLVELFGMIAYLRWVPRLIPVTGDTGQQSAVSGRDEPGCECGVQRFTVSVPAPAVLSAPAPPRACGGEAETRHSRSG